MPEKFKEIHIDVEKGIFSINGRDIGINNVTNVLIKIEGNMISVDTEQCFFMEEEDGRTETS